MIQLKGTEDEVDSAVSTIENMENLMNAGVDKTHQVTGVLNNIIESIEDVSRKMKEIMVAMEVQSNSTKEASEAVGGIKVSAHNIESGSQNIDTNVNHQMEMVEKVVLTTRSLTEASEKLERITSTFKL